MKKIIVIGSINLDLVFHVEDIAKAQETIPSKSAQRFLGGKGLNQALALSKAYPDISLYAIVSINDKYLLEEIKALGIKEAMIESLPGETGMAFIQVDKTGQNCIVLHKGVNHSFEETRINRVLSECHEGDLIVLQNEINALKTIITLAKQKRLKIAFNPSPFDFTILDLPLEDVDYLIFNEVEGQRLSHFKEPELILETLHKRYPNTVLVLTLGADGVMAQENETTTTMESHKVEVVDTTAAGDAFTGYFLAGVLKGLSVAEALEMGNAAGALSVTRQGASTSIPSLDEVLQAVIEFSSSPKKIKQAL